VAYFASLALRCFDLMQNDTVVGETERQLDLLLLDLSKDKPHEAI
jgi:hypothetical protein